MKTLFTPHPHGVQSVDISDDALFICTLSVPFEASISECLPLNFCLGTPRDRRLGLDYRLRLPNIERAFVDT